MRIPINIENDFYERSRQEEILEDNEIDYSEEFEEEEESCSGSYDEEGAEAWKRRCICMKADFENYKKHAEAEHDRLAEIGKEVVLAELFPIAEHLDRAVAEAGKMNGNDGIIEGLELVQKELEKVFERYEIERIPTVGECFNPEVHEAVGVIKAEGVCEGTIVEELKAGFRRGDKLLDPARVVVAK